MVYECYDSINVFSKPLIAINILPSEITSSQISFTARIKSDSKIDYCKVFLNNIEIQEDNPRNSLEDPMKKDNYSIIINKVMILREGSNIIRVKVKNAEGEIEEQRTIEYKPNKSENAFIVWNHFPTVTNDPHVELDATIKSTFKDLDYQVFQNESELPLSKGSPDWGDNKLDDFQFFCKIKRILTLEEGDNRIKIVVKNAQGKVFKTGQKVITYTPKEKRIALVIGNQDYDKATLNQPVNDAKAIASKLEELGFTVTYKPNLNYNQMKTIADKFVSDSKGCEIALFYFSGHGEQVSATNYLLPVDFDFKKDHGEDRGFPATYVLKSEAEMKIVIIDACRTMNTKGPIDDLEKMNQSDVLFAYSSAPNQVSYQGTGKYSVYTEALLKELEKANLKIDELFRNVAATVKETAKRINIKQVPYTEGSLTKDFIFNNQP